MLIEGNTVTVVHCVYRMGTRGQWYFEKQEETETLNAIGAYSKPHQKLH